MPITGRIPDFINGKWQTPADAQFVAITNPATGENLGEVPSEGQTGVSAAVAAASAAFPSWRRTPPEERIQYLFGMKEMFEKHLEELARLITQENGKTLAESRGELRRAIENVEVACGIPTLMQGYNLEDVAKGIDEMMIRQPLGVVGVITPFNFPLMVPFWFVPYALACGNTLVVKPSEKVPLTMRRVFELMDERLKLPAGVANLVNGGKAAVDALLDHPDVRAISFVGSTPVARYIYSKASANGKRVQCQGGAKNHVVVMPDADVEMSTQIVTDSAFGCAGQRCLAVSVAVTVGEARDRFREAIAASASSIKVGYGLEEGIQMGPVISRESQTRIQGLIAQGLKEGGRILVGGSDAKVSGHERGNFLSPTVLDDIPVKGVLSRTEIFGPVLTLVNAATLDDALEVLSYSAYGNAASIFTSSGAAARKFRYEVSAGNVGINIGVAAPMAYFPFSGWKDSFLGVLHGQGRDGVEFYTDKKVVVERWPKEWSRKF